MLRRQNKRFFHDGVMRANLTVMCACHPAFARTECWQCIFRIVLRGSGGDARPNHAGLGSIIATSETLLTAIAIRLAAILVAGLVARNAATDLPRQQAAFAS